MTPTQKAEYDFFMRLKQLCEARMLQCCGYENQALRQQFTQAKEDAARCDQLAQVIQAGQYYLVEVTE